MAAQVLPCFMTLLLGLCSGSSTLSERGRVELRRVRTLATQSRYGECWARALEHLGTRCKDLTAESQSRLAVMLTECHLSSSGRHFPSCPAGSEVSRCTAEMDAVAFNAYTEFFTHTHSMCHFLQSEAWQSHAESTMHRLTDSSASVAEQLQSTRLMAEELLEAQSAALQAQQQILSSGEELRVTLRDSTQGLRALFLELSTSSREQQVALSELFSRVSFLQSFLLMESHSLSSCCYNAAALCASFLLTSTQRSSRARLVLLVLVCLNFFLERRICHSVLSSDRPEHTHMELISVYVSVLRRLMTCVGACVLLWVCVVHKDPVQQSLEVLQQLRETQRSLQEALQEAGRREEEQRKTDRWLKRRRAEALMRRGQEEQRPLVEDSTDLSHSGSPGVPGSSSADVTHDASVVGRHASSPLVYSILVDQDQDQDQDQPRYSLRTRRTRRSRRSRLLLQSQPADQKSVSGAVVLPLQSTGGSGPRWVPAAKLRPRLPGGGGGASGALWLC